MRKDISLFFRLERDDAKGTFTVHLSADGREAQSEFLFDFTDKALNGLLKRIESGEERCRDDDLREAGINLWEGLMAGEVGKLFASLQQENAENSPRFLFRLALLHPQVELLPWQCLYFDDYDGGSGFLSCHPDYAVVRVPVKRISAPLEPLPVQSRLRVLVVIPEGSDLDVDRE